MIPMSSRALAVVTGSWKMSMRAESWRGDELLSVAVPVAGGDETLDRQANIQERARITVPRVVDGVSWDPTGDPDHPLAPFGQTLRVSIGVDLGNGLTEWVPRGTYLIRDVQVASDTVSVEAAGLLALIEEAKFAVPFQATGTFKSTVRDLIEPALTVLFDDALTDRSIPNALASWDTDRIGALYDILDAWPAVARVTNDGYLIVEPFNDLLKTPSLTLTDVTGGTVERITRSSTRAGVYSMVIARGRQTDGAEPVGVAINLDPDSPMSWDDSATPGRFNPLPVPYEFKTPLLTTVAECKLAADQKLRWIQTLAAQTFDLTCSPHPGLQVGDVVTLAPHGYAPVDVSIEGLTTPFFPGAQTMKVRAL